MASVNCASAFFRVMSAIFAFNACKLARADSELFSSDFQVRSVVEAKVSKARRACSMLIFMRSLSGCGISGLKASWAMELSFAFPPCGGSGGVGAFLVHCCPAFSIASSIVQQGQEAAHKKFLNNNNSI